MKVGYLIGRLGRGGAELQLMRLSRAMTERGHQVEVLCYDGASPLDDDLREMGVAVRAASAPSRAAKIALVRTWTAGFEPDLVHAVMKRASSLAVMARLPRRRPPIIATDMSTATYGRHKPILWASLIAFALADCVVTQTELNRSHLDRLAPWLRRKTKVIRNGVDVARFSPPMSAPVVETPFRFCVAGTVYPVKNPDRVVQAVAELRHRGRTGFRVDWYGRLGTGSSETTPGDLPTLALARELAVTDAMHFHGDTPNIEHAYRSADALLHASVQEGFPNVVAEGMATGLPLVVSSVSDLPMVVRTARNGYVFDEFDVQAMANAMEHMLDTTAEERRAMGERSRSLAVEWFGLERFADEFEALYEQLAGRR